MENKAVPVDRDSAHAPVAADHPVGSGHGDDASRSLDGGAIELRLLPEVGGKIVGEKKTPEGEKDDAEKVEQGRTGLAGGDAAQFRRHRPRGRCGQQGG